MGLQVPELPGGYYHDYICPEHGIELSFDSHRPTEHRCPADGKIFRGEKLDAAWRWFVNHHLSESALRLAALWHVSGDASARDAVLQILLNYASRYERYGRGHHNEDNPGIATYTTLDESVWCIALTWAYALIAESLSRGDRHTIESELLSRAAWHLVDHRYPRVHNFACWHNAAIATVGHVIGDSALIRTAGIGQRTQLDQGIFPDGLWYEGSMSYHFYSVWALLMSAVALRHHPEYDILGHESLQRALTAPLQCAYPDGGLPATNDCWYFTSILGPCCHGVPPASDFYELGLSLWGNPEFAQPLHRAYAEKPRSSVYALLLGVDEIPAAPVTPLPPVLLCDSGLAILRPRPDSQLVLKFSPHGGAHGHPDKLSLIVSADGWRCSPDLGTPAYGVPSHETWFRQTLSHNTVLVDGESQPPAAGARRRFEIGSEFQLAEAAVGWDGVLMRRTILSTPAYFLDAFEVLCDRPRQIDWVYHNAGQHSTAGQPAELTGGLAYQHLQDVHEHSGSTVEFRDGSHRMQVWLHEPEGSRTFTGSAPANPPSERRSFVLRRRQQAHTIFLSVFHPYREIPALREVAWLPDGVRIETEHHIDEWPLQLLLPSLPARG